ncbi:MAG: hypothetical protein KDA41_11865 [Planctomycetales bacterium]|nr:hypothetical protein [Planctomycetales bacterium]
MTFNRLTIAAAVLCIAGAANQAQAAGYAHLDGLAVSMQSQARDLYNEFGLHFRHAAHFDHLRSDAANLYYLARHVHEVAHAGGATHHLEADLAQLDSVFHHLEDLVAHIEDDAHFGGGHIHGSTYHVQLKLRQMETTIHHMQSDVTEMLHPIDHFHGFGGPYGGGHLHDDHDDHHGHGGPVVVHSFGNGGGISFGSGGIRIRFGH